MNHSISSLTLFEKCPWLFYKKNIIHAAEPQSGESNINMAIGLAVHKSIEAQLNGVGKDLADINALKESFQNPPDSALIYMKSLSVIPQEFLDASHGCKVHAEKRLFFRLPTTRVSEPFTTKFDAYWVDGSKLFIYDWKTGSHIDADAERQMQFYALGGLIATQSGETPITEVSCTLHYLKLHQSKTMQYVWNCEDLNDVLAWATDVAESIESRLGSQGDGDSEKLWERNKESSECNWCPYRTECFVSL